MALSFGGVLLELLYGYVRPSEPQGTVYDPIRYEQEARTLTRFESGKLPSNMNRCDSTSSLSSTFVGLASVLGTQGGLGAFD